MQLPVVHLIRVVEPNPPTTENFRDDQRIGGIVQAAVPADERLAVIIAHQHIEPRRPFPGGKQSRRQQTVGFESRKAGQAQQIVQTAQHFHVGIHIDSAETFQGIQPDIVGDERELAPLVCLTGEPQPVHVETVLVPELELVVGKKLPPRGQAMLRQFGHLSPAEPAIVNDFRYHTSPFIRQI